MLLIYLDEKSLDEAERSVLQESTSSPSRSPRRASTSPPPPPPHVDAASVRIRSGKRLVTDGPFAETHEQLAGYS
jgi:hypothetical protein